VASFGASNFVERPLKIFFRAVSFGLAGDLDESLRLLRIVARRVRFSCHDRDYIKSVVKRQPELAWIGR